MAEPALGYRLGLPAWAYPGWRDRYFVDQPSRLASYAQVFNTVEGNTTFYRIPDADTVARWRSAVDGRDFRFCLKLPRETTHEARPDRRALETFLSVIEPLAPHLGPLLVQFPAAVGPRQMPLIDQLVARVSERYSAAVEVRHPAFFKSPDTLDDLLARRGASRVSLDARPIHLGDATHPDVAAARHKKPDLPLHAVALNGHAFIRLVLHPDAGSNEAWLDEWIARAAGWLADGVTLWMLIHCPNNDHCPAFALDFHRRLAARVPVRELPEWPVPQQTTLF